MKGASHKMYYAAIVCPAEINEKVLQFKNWMKASFGCVVALKSPAHITLIPPFWLEEMKESELLQTLQTFTSKTVVPDIQTDGFSHFGRKVLFVNVKKSEALEQIKQEAEEQFIQTFSNIKRDDRPFHPHITIANRDLKPGDFVKAWEVFSKNEFRESFPAKTISLLKLGPGKWDVIGSKTWDD